MKPTKDVVANRKAAWLWYSTFAFMPGTGRPRVSGFTPCMIPEIIFGVTQIMAFFRRERSERRIKAIN